MMAVWSAWVRITSTRERATALAVFRVCVGVVVVATLASIVYADLVGFFWIDGVHGGALSLGNGNWLLSRIGGPTHGVVWAIVITGLVSGALVAIGLGGRASTLVAAQSYLALSTINGDAIGGYDLMTTNALWLLFLGRPNETLSVDCFIRNRTWTSDALVSAWPRYLAILQLVVVYGATGLHKLSPVWTPAGGYSALYWVFQEPTWRRFDLSWSAHVYPLTQVATAITWHWELAAPLLLLVYYFRATRGQPGRLRALFNRRDLRVAFAAIGLSLHLGILVLLNVGPFSWISFSYYVCLWTPEEVERVFRRLRPRASAPAAPAAATT
jgi:hypothetical protein